MRSRILTFSFYFSHTVICKHFHLYEFHEWMHIDCCICVQMWAVTLHRWIGVTFRWSRSRPPRPFLNCFGVAWASLFVLILSLFISSFASAVGQTSWARWGLTRRPLWPMCPASITPSLARRRYMHSTRPKTESSHHIQCTCTVTTRIFTVGHLRIQLFYLGGGGMKPTFHYLIKFLHIRSFCAQAKVTKLSLLCRWWNLGVVSVNSWYFLIKFIHLFIHLVCGWDMLFCGSPWMHIKIEIESIFLLLSRCSYLP